MFHRWIDILSWNFFLYTGILYYRKLQNRKLKAIGEAYLLYLLCSI